MCHEAVMKISKEKGEKRKEIEEKEDLINYN